MGVGGWVHVRVRVRAWWWWCDEWGCWAGGWARVCVGWWLVVVGNNPSSQHNAHPFTILPPSRFIPLENHLPPLYPLPLPTHIPYSRPQPRPAHTTVHLASMPSRSLRGCSLRGRCPEGSSLGMSTVILRGPLVLQGGGGRWGRGQAGGQVGEQAGSSLGISTVILRGPLVLQGGGGTSGQVGG